MTSTPEPHSPTTSPERARAVKIQRVAVVGFALLEAVAIAWALFR